MKKENILTIVIVALIVLLGVYYIESKNKNQIVYLPQVIENNSQEEVSEISDVSNLKKKIIREEEIKESVEIGVPELPSKYISVQSNWPPVIFNSLEEYRCDTGKTSGDVFVLTEEKNINGKIYCVSTMREGAAGTTYIMYTYKTNSWYGIKLTTFSLGFSNCGNYSEPQNSECKNVRSNFDIDSIISSLDWK